MRSTIRRDALQAAGALTVSLMALTVLAADAHAQIGRASGAP